MCFHTKQTKKAIEIENRFNAKFENRLLYQPSNHYNGFSYPKTPIITVENLDKIEMINWGLLPHWAKDDFDKSNTLNARIETITEKISFKNVLNNRCIILANGFYEWQQIGNKKMKYEIGINNDLFAFAGLFDYNNGTKTYTVLTTAAKGIMMDIHNTKLRMPVVLYDDLETKNWLLGLEIQPHENFTTIPNLYYQNLLF